MTPVGDPFRIHSLPCGLSYNTFRPSEHNQLARFRLHFHKVFPNHTRWFLSCRPFFANCEINYLAFPKCWKFHFRYSIFSKFSIVHTPVPLAEQLVPGFALARCNPCFGVGIGTRAVTWWLSKAGYATGYITNTVTRRTSWKTKLYYSWE